MVCKTIDELVDTLYQKISEFPVVIGISGHIGTGKTYTSSKLTEIFTNDGFSTLVAPIACSLKHMTIALTQHTKSGRKINFVENDLKLQQVLSLSCVNDCMKQHKDNWRFLIQCIGENIRRFVGEDFWINHLYERYLQHSCYDIALIPDVRYKNEESFLRSHFQHRYIQIKVETPLDVILKRLSVNKETYMKWLQHESERDIDYLSYDVKFENV